MENPSQLIYTTEQLFALAPVVIEHQKPQLQPKMINTVPTPVQNIDTSDASLWDNHKWIIVILGTAIIGGTCYYFYRRWQKSKESNQAG